MNFLDPEKTETAYVLGVVPEDDGLHRLVTHRAKVGHTCCGCCCDMRRAVIIVNLVLLANIIVNSVNYTVFLSGDGGSDVMASFDDMRSVDDDFSVKYMKGMRFYFCALFIFLGIKIVCCIFGIVGAFRYNVNLTGIAAVSFCFDFLIGLFGVILNGSIRNGIISYEFRLDWFSKQYMIPQLLVSGFFAYPHFFFIKEVRDGSMSKQNYVNEEMSCCCVKKTENFQ